MFTFRLCVVGLKSPDCFIYILGKLKAVWVHFGKEKSRLRPHCRLQLPQGRRCSRWCRLALSEGQWQSTRKRNETESKEIQIYKYKALFMKQSMQLPLVILFQLSLFNHSFWVGLLFHILCTTFLTFNNPPYCSTDEKMVNPPTPDQLHCIFFCFGNDLLFLWIKMV